jgi:flavin reductase (DIM6/NTAB) family NADH-FMN oxidoreductase RutF
MCVCVFLCVCVCVCVPCPQGLSHAYLECEVVSRMDAGDHYVLYANVKAGDVLDDNVVTAVHHRKVGNHY